MRRFLVCTFAAFAFGAAAGALAPAMDDAEAVPSGDVLGRYQVRFKGDGFSAKPALNPRTIGELDYDTGHFATAGILEIVPRDETVNDGLVTVRIHLAQSAQKSLLAGAAGQGVAFEGTAAVVGDSLAVIDAGQPNYVNALFLRFEKGGRRIVGNWTAVFPANELDLVTQGFATAVSVSIKGGRKLRSASSSSR